MKKRISCFVLAFVMVLLAIPTFALSALEGATPYTTAWSANMPTVTPAASTVVYNGAWYIGNKSDANNFTLFANYAPAGGEYAKLIAFGTGDQWTNGGCYTERYGDSGTRALIVPADRTVSVRYIAEYNGAATVNVDDILFYAKNGKASISMALVHNGTVVWPQGATYNTVSTWFYADTKVGVDVADDVNATLKDVVLNLKKGDSVEFVFRRCDGASDSWGCYGFDPAITYADIAGQTAYTKSSYAASYGAHRNTVQPMFYAAWKAEQAEDADTSAAAYGEYLQDFGKITFSGAWSNGIVYSATGTYEPIARWMFFADKDLNATGWDTSWGVTETYWQAALAEAFLTGNKRNPWGDNAGTMHMTLIGGVQPSSSNTLYTFAYEASESGYASFSFDEVCSPKISMGLGILVDGYMVWPNAGADIGVAENYYTVEANTANVTATVNAALASLSVYVEEGSLVQFVVRKNASWASSDLYGNGLVLKPAVVMETGIEDKAVVTYIAPSGAPLNRIVCTVGDAFPTLDLLATWDIDGDGVADKLPRTVTESVTVTAVEYYGEDHFNKFSPVLSGSTVQFKGKWTVGGGNWSSTDLSAKGLTWIQDELFTRWDGWAFVGETTNSLWGANGGGMYASRCFATKAPARGIGAIYTVPADGIVDLSFDKLMGSREIGANDNRYNQEGTLAYYVAILKNGEVIWPTDSSAYFFESTSTYTGTGQTFDYLTLDYPALPTDLAVEAGDEIAFVANMGNNLSWMLFMEPAVTYTALTTETEPQAPEIDFASATLNDQFAANFYVNLDTVPEGATNVGVYINGEFTAIDEDGMVTLGGIAAKELADDITVRATYTLGEDEYLGDNYILSVADILTDYTRYEGVAQEIKNLAIATLNYATAAQIYFDYNTENLANADLSEEQKAVAYTGTYEDGATITDVPLETVVASVYGVKLMLNDTVDMAIYYKSEVDLTALNCVLVAAYVGGEPTMIEAEVTKVGTDLYKVIVTGFMPSAWGLDYQFVLATYDGESGAMISNGLTYAITDYCIRMQNTEIDAVVDAMLALHEAAMAVLNVA